VSKFPPSKAAVGFLMARTIFLNNPTALGYLCSQSRQSSAATADSIDTTRLIAFTLFFLASDPHGVPFDVVFKFVFQVDYPIAE
jgi:hypothetical protein